MSYFIGRPPLLKFAMGWHRNHAISHSPTQNFFEDTFVSHPGGSNEHFGTHEKLSWGVQGNLNWMPGYSSWSPLWDIPASIRFVNVSFMVVSVTSNSLYWGC